MKQIVLVLVLFTIGACTTFQKQNAASDDVKNYYQGMVDSLKYVTMALVDHAEDRQYSDFDSLFRLARKFYKRTEGLTEFYFPGIARALNGPALYKLEEEDEKIIEPSGFQVVEELIFSVQDVEHDRIIEEVKILNSSVTRLQALVSSVELTNENIFEAVRLQLLRLMSLGLSGFDSPICNNSIAEADQSLIGIKDILASFSVNLTDEEEEVWKILYTEFYFCRNELAKAPGFEDLDRAYFFTRFLDPLCRAVYRYQQALNIANNGWPGAVDLSEPSFFEDSVFNTVFFARSESEHQPKVQQLGQLLFFDPILSGNNARACASCHRPSNGFADPTARSTSFDGVGKVYRNTPTLVNSVFQQSQFWDGRVAFIEDQIGAVISNPDEMHGNFSRTVNILANSADYSRLFAEAFADEAVTEANLKTALASYVRSLHALNSRFDKYLRGDYSILTEEEIRGFNLFMGKGKCGTCHFFPLFNGSVPPTYKETESEVLGVPAMSGAADTKLDGDPGRSLVFAHRLFMNMFKTPTVRNATITGPYMHNGVFSSLKDVLDFYDHGGGAGMNLPVENQTLPADSLHLTDGEKKAIIAFIGSLTDTTNLTEVPTRLPSLTPETLNARRIAGDY